MSDTPPPIPPDQDKIHLRWLMIGHVAFATLQTLLIVPVLSLAAIYAKLGMLSQQSPDKPEAPTVLSSLISLLIISALILLPNAISAALIRRRKYRSFSMIVAVFDLIFLPLGTALGVFTIVILMRDSVAAKYRENA